MLVYRLIALPTLASLAALVACAPGDKPFPSLAPRPIEKIAADDSESRTQPSSGQAALGPTDPALDRAAQEQVAAAEASVAPFAEQLATARAAVAAAKNAAPGSEGWIVAQATLSRLDRERGPAAIAVATLDQLRIDSANRAAPVDTSRLDQAWERASAIKADQDEAYLSLADALPPA